MKEQCDEIYKVDIGGRINMELSDDVLEELESLKLWLELTCFWTGLGSRKYF